MIRVLIVEPDPMYRRLFPIWIRNHFASLGVEVCAASDSREALEAARRSHPDLLLTAFELEKELDGLQLARRLSTAGSELSVIVVCQTDYLLLQERLGQSPQTRYLARPVGEKTFVATVDAALRTIQPSANGSSAV